MERSSGKGDLCCYIFIRFLVASADDDCTTEYLFLISWIFLHLLIQNAGQSFFLSDETETSLTLVGDNIPSLEI